MLGLDLQEVVMVVEGVVEGAVDLVEEVREKIVGPYQLRK